MMQKRGLEGPREAKNAGKTMLSIPHLIIIFVVALVVFGPEKLPELARNLGKVMAEFRRATGDLRSTFEDHLRDLERETEQRRIGGAPNPSPPRATEASVPIPGSVPTSAPNSAGRTEQASYASVAPSSATSPPDDPDDPEPNKTGSASGTMTDGHSPS
jgi:TatA/E family protein of Tat protein translocase